MQWKSEFVITICDYWIYFDVACRHSQNRIFRKTCVYIIVVAMSEPSKSRDVQDLKYKGESVYVKTDAMEVSPIESSGSTMEMDDLNSPDLSSESEAPAAPAVVVPPPQESFDNLDQEMNVSQDSSPNTTKDNNSQIMESESTTNNTGGKRRTRKSNRKTKRANKKNRKSRTRR